MPYLGFRGDLAADAHAAVQAYRAAERLSEKVYWLSSENTPAEDECVPPPAPLWALADSLLRRAAMLAIVSGDYDILYVSPERCEQLVESGSLSGAGKPDLVVVDEAHCVVDWAFRDSYVNLKRTRCAALQLRLATQG